MTRVWVSNLGCRMNRVELDAMASELEAMGSRLVDAEDADAVIINTCAVTGEAEAKSRHAVRHALALPREPRVYVTGCAATLFGGEFTELGPRVVVEPDKSRVARLLVLESGEGLSVGLRERAEDASVTPTGRTRPGIKVQDGCDLRCSYCIVWKARGPARSESPDAVVRLVRAAMERGAHEVVLTGINLGRYQSEGLDLAGLLERVLGETAVGRVRLSSIEPQDVTARLVQVMASSEGRVAPFLHMCLQSGSDGVLARMGRVYTTDDFMRHVDVVRSKVPEASIATDVIVGFPGETDAEFEESLGFCERVGFSKMHVFRFSKRPGTPAAVMRGQVDPRVAARRSRMMRELSGRMRAQLAQRLVGTTQRVVVQEAGRATSGGLFDVEVPSDMPVNALADVRIAHANADGTLIAAP